MRYCGCKQTTHFRAAPPAVEAGTEMQQISRGACPQLVEKSRGIASLRVRWRMRLLSQTPQFLTRPVATHSATKIFPSASKHASWGCTNLPASHFDSSVRILKPPVSSLFLLNPLGIGAQVGDHLVVFIQQRHAGHQLGHHHHIAMDVDIRRPQKTIERVPMLSLQSEPLQPIEFTVGHHNQRFLTPVVDPDAMRQFERAIGLFVDRSPG